MRVGHRLDRFPGFLPGLAIATGCFLQVGFLPGVEAQEKNPAQTRAAKAAPPKAAAAKPAAAVPASYEVIKGDTLFRIAGKFRHQGVTLNQMLLGLYTANPEAFLEGNINSCSWGAPSRFRVAMLSRLWSPQKQHGNYECSSPSHWRLSPPLRPHPRRR